MEYRNHRNRKGQTGLPYSIPTKSTQKLTSTDQAEPAVVNGFARYTMVQSIAAAVILAVIVLIRFISGNTYQNIQVGMREGGIAGSNISDAVQQVMSYVQESETFSQLFPDDATLDQGDGAVWTSSVLAEDELSYSVTTDLVCPIVYTKITSDFGSRTDPFSGQYSFHKGIDMAAQEGSNVHSAADGTVVACDYDEIGGWYIVINHTDCLQTYYGHLSKILVKAGDGIRAGQVIALSGNSGKTTGPHLHFEVVDHGQNMDPMAYLNV